MRALRGARGGAAAGGADTWEADPGLGAPGRGPAVRRGVPPRRAGRRRRRDPRAAAAAGAARPPGARGCALARRELPLRPGPAGLRQDVAGREGGRRPHAGRSAHRRHVAQSHKAISKLLEEIEREAREQGFPFRGRKKSTTGNEGTRFEGQFIDWRDDWRDLLDEELQLVAGTSWLFARADFDGLPRHADRRRGGPGLTRRRRRGRARGAEPRPARRPEPASAGLAGRDAGGGEGVRSSSTSSARRRPCRRTAGSSSSARGACGPS